MSFASKMLDPSFGDLDASPERSGRMGASPSFP